MSFKIVFDPRPITNKFAMVSAFRIAAVAQGVNPLDVRKVVQSAWGARGLSEATNTLAPYCNAVQDGVEVDLSGDMLIKAVTAQVTMILAEHGSVSQPIVFHHKHGAIVVTFDDKGQFQIEWPLEINLP